MSFLVELYAKFKQIYSEPDYQLLKYTVDFATEMHAGQLRVSGEPYIVHPLHVADILSDLGMDAVCIGAAILHDVLEDTDCTSTEFKKKFGNTVFTLVEGVTKLSSFQYTSQEDAQIENYRKLFFAAVNDVRVIIIKLADRLHNMRTLDPMPREKQIRIARETLEIYAPLAGRLGIASIKSELEDLAMKYLYPDEYEQLSNSVDKSRGERIGFVMRIASEIEVSLSELNLKGEVKGRPKHLYSIFKKMNRLGKTMEQIYDLIAVRVIVETVNDCYTILGVIHSKWRPVPGRFKDYIAIPKPNKYQSLHTTVVTEFGQVFEIQIRTYEMNRTAEYGIAAHWVYKEKGSVNASSDFDTKISWLREVIEIEDLKDGNEFLNNIKLNIVSDDIYVFTPKGEVLDLPIGSTCVDFAYKVHSEVGNRCIGAKVNSKMVPLNTSLENGDVVEIMTSSSGKGPSRDWLKFVTTMQAKAKIRNFLKKQLQTDNIKLGREMLERESKHKGYVLTDLLNTKNALESVMTRYSFASEDDMFASIGYGGVTTKQVLVKLIDAYQKEQVMHHPELAIKPIQQSELNKAKKKRLNGVIVEGYDDFLIKFSKCCNPVPGDNIVGYAARGTGVSIHRVDCTNIKSMEKERLMKAAWSDGDTSTFVVQLMLTCDDKSGLLNEIISLIAQLGYSISSMEVHVKSDKTQLKKAFISLGIFIRNTMDIEYIIKKLKEISNVNTITRNG